MSHEVSLPKLDDLDSILDSLDDVSEVSDEVVAYNDFMARHGDGDGGFDPLLSALGAQPHVRDGYASLSADEHRFAILVANSGKVTESYTQVFDVDGLDRFQIKTHAAKLARKAYVSAKISEVREQIAKSAGIGVASLVSLVDEAIEMGRQQQDPKVILSAVDRLSGLLGIGENQKRKDTASVVVMLDDDTRSRMLNQLITLRDDIIDVTPTQEAPE